MRNPVRWTATVLTAALGAAAVAYPAAAEAPPTPPVGPVTIQSVATGRVADVVNSVAQDGRGVQEWTYNGSPAQQWTLTGTAAPYRIVSGVNPAFCLGRESAGVPGRVLLRPCGDPEAGWVPHAAGGDRYRLGDPAGTRYLRAAGSTAGNLLTGGGDGEAAQWYLAGLDVPRRTLPADPRLDQLSFLTAHNAMANSDEGFRLRFPNQSYRLREQLRHGVRGLQVDAHASRNEVRMCHGSCWGNERSLAAGLRDVLDFLRSDRGAVVTVFIEDYTTVEQLRAELARVAGLDEVLLRPDRWGVRERGWPRLSELLATGKRLLILSQSPGRDGFGVYFDRDWTVENYWSLGGSGNETDCWTRWAEVPLNRQEPGFRRLHVMNHYRNIPTEAAATADNAGKLRHRVQRLCGPAAGRKPNYVAVDFYQRPDGATADLLRDLSTYW